MAAPGKGILTACAALALGHAAPLAYAQAFPSQPIELVAHTAPGGGTDQYVRLLSEVFVREKLVSQQPTVSNRVGGGGAIAYNYVKGRKGDPHVILAIATGTFLSALTRTDLGFSIDDFTPIAFLAMDPQVVAVTGDSRFTSVKELIDAAKREPNTIVSAIASATGSGRLFQYMLEKETGARFKYVSFKSGSEAGTAVAGGHIHLTTENHSEVAAHLESKKVRVLAVTGEKRMAVLPNVPTMQELGYKDFDITQFVGLMVPAKTDAAIVRRLQEEVAKALKAPEVIEKLQNEGGNDLIGGSPEAFAAVIQRELAMYKKLVTDAKISKD